MPISSYEVLYLYTGASRRVVESGEMSNGVLATRTTLKLPGNKLEVIDAILKVVNNNELYFESRSSETNGQIDYTCRYLGKK